MAADKSHLYAAAGLPVNTYVPSGQVNENKSHLAFQTIPNTTFPIANPHGGEEQIGNYSTGIYMPTAAQISNQANTDKYPLNDYSADYRFGQEALANSTGSNLKPTPNTGGGGG